MIKAIFSAAFILLPVHLGADTMLININSDDTFDQVVNLTDWDSVVANDHWMSTQIALAFSTPPLKVLFVALADTEIFAYLKRVIFEGRDERQKLKGFTAHLDYAVSRVEALQSYRDAILHRIVEAYPRVPMVVFYQQLQANGVPIVVATNNDYETLMIKSQKLDARLAAKQLPPFNFDAAYCGGLNKGIISGKAPNGMLAGFVPEGKDSDAYFEALYRFVRTDLGYDPQKTLFMFTDDKRRNVERACNVAQKEGIRLLGVVRNRADTKIINEVTPILADHAPTAIRQIFPIFAK